MKIENSNNNLIIILKRLTAFSMSLCKNFIAHNSCKVNRDDFLSLNLNKLIERKVVNNHSLFALSDSLEDFSRIEIIEFKKEFDFLRIFEAAEVYVGEMSDLKYSIILLSYILTGEIKSLSVLKKKSMELRVSSVYHEHQLRAQLFFKSLNKKDKSIFNYLEEKITSADRNEQLLLLLNFLKDNIKPPHMSAEKFVNQSYSLYNKFLIQCQELIKLKLYLLSDRSIFLKVNDTLLSLLKIINSFDGDDNKSTEMQNLKIILLFFEDFNKALLKKIEFFKAESSQVLSLFFLKISSFLVYYTKISLESVIQFNISNLFSTLNNDNNSSNNFKVAIKNLRLEIKKTLHEASYFSAKEIRVRYYSSIIRDFFDGINLKLQSFILNDSNYQEKVGNLLISRALLSHYLESMCKVEDKLFFLSVSKKLDQLIAARNLKAIDRERLPKSYRLRPIVSDGFVIMPCQTFVSRCFKRSFRPALLHIHVKTQNWLDLVLLKKSYLLSSVPTVNLKHESANIVQSQASSKPSSKKDSRLEANQIVLFQSESSKRSLPSGIELDSLAKDPEILSVSSPPLAEQSSYKDHTLQESSANLEKQVESLKGKYTKLKKPSLGKSMQTLNKLPHDRGPAIKPYRSSKSLQLFSVDKRSRSLDGEISFRDFLSSDTSSWTSVFAVEPAIINLSSFKDSSSIQEGSLLSSSLQIENGAMVAGEYGSSSQRHQTSSFKGFVGDTSRIHGTRYTKDSQGSSLSRSSLQKSGDGRTNHDVIMRPTEFRSREFSHSQELTHGPYPSSESDQLRGKSQRHSLDLFSSGTQSRQIPEKLSLESYFSRSETKPWVVSRKGNSHNFDSISNSFLESQDSFGQEVIHTRGRQGEAILSRGNQLSQKL